MTAQPTRRRLGARLLTARLLTAPLLVACTVAAAFGLRASAAAPAAVAPPVKVMIVSLFGPEAAPWLKALQPLRDIAVPGLPQDFPAVHCTPDSICQMTLGMGHANAAASIMAVVYSELFDLRQTYFVVAGIAGIDPARGGIGTAAWARYVVDGGITHELDARELPTRWKDGFFGVLTGGPDEYPKLEYGSELFQLNEALLQRALDLSRAVVLEDSADVQAYRQKYRERAAAAAPHVTQCDTLSADTWYIGRRLGERATRWTALLTHGKGAYCTTQQEDNAVMTALTRGGRSGLLDIERVAILRSGSDFDRPYPGQTPQESLQAQLALAGGFRIATDNLVRAALPLVQNIAQHWDVWQSGIPAAVP